MKSPMASTLTTHPSLTQCQAKTVPLRAVFQERLVLSVLPRFVVLEMINDMTNVEDEHPQHQFHRIYIHRYENVRWEARLPRPASVCRARPGRLASHCQGFRLPARQHLSSFGWSIR